MGVVRRIYGHFDMPLSSGAERRMTAFIASNPRDKHGTHRYTPAMFGLDPAEISRQFADYYRRFGVPRAKSEGGENATD